MVPCFGKITTFVLCVDHADVRNIVFYSTSTGDWNCPADDWGDGNGGRQRMSEVALPPRDGKVLPVNDMETLLS